MSDQTDIFSEGNKEKQGASTQTPESAPQSASPEQQFLNELANIRNERGEQKYDSIPKALEGLRNAQEYIPQLKEELSAKDQELQQLREAVAKQESVDDLVSRLTASQASEGTPEQGLDEQKVTALFEQLIDQRDTTRKYEANKVTVHEALVSKFGDATAASQAVKDKAAELGTTVQEIGELSKQNPKMVLALFGGSSPKPNASPPQSGVNTEGFTKDLGGNEELTPPTKSLLSGATYKEQAEYLRKIRENVYKRHNIET